MYRGFNLKVKYKDNKELREIGLNLNNEFQEEIKRKIDGFVLNDRNATTDF